MITYQDIKRLCKEKGVTITGAEKALGFAKGSLCKIETSKPSMERVKKISDYFNIPITDFYDKEVKKNEINITSMRKLPLLPRISLKIRS